MAAQTTDPAQILLAEDNAPDVFLIRQALQQIQAPHQLFVVDDGEKAIDFIERADVDKNAPCPTLLLLDLNLPKHSGDEVLQRLRRSARCGHIPVVILTSSDAPQDRLRAAVLGANSYFLKPSELNEFMKLGQVVAKFIGSAS